jgi:hypothetical protein
MPKDYLGDIDYPTIVTKIEENKDKTEPVISVSEEKMKELMQRMRTIVKQLECGESPLSSRAIHLVKGTCPALSALNAFSKFPTEHSIKQLLQTAEQDFGWRVAKEFANIISEAYPKATMWVR